MSSSITTRPKSQLNKISFWGGFSSLAARKLIQLLQDRENNGDVKKEIIQLGCRYGKQIKQEISQVSSKQQSIMTLTSAIHVGLASRYTSYVAVDPKEQKELKESWMMMKSRDIPVQVAHGCSPGGSHMLRVMARQCVANSSSGPVLSGPPSVVMFPAMSFSAPPPVAMPLMSNQAPMMKSMMRTAQPQSRNAPMSRTIFSESCDDAAVESMSFGGSTNQNQPQETTDDDKLMKLVSSQNFDGSFKLEASIAQLLETTLDDIAQGTTATSH